MRFCYHTRLFIADETLWRDVQTQPDREKVMKRVFWSIVALLIAGHGPLDVSTAAQNDQPAPSSMASISDWGSADSELETFRRMLMDPTRTSSTRMDAATLLLSRGQGPAEAVLLEVLQSPAPPESKTAVASAIATARVQRSAFIEPLFGLLRSEDAPVRDKAATALSIYIDGGVLERLQDIASDEAESWEVRRAAMQGLSNMPDKRAVRTLILLLRSPHPDVRATAARNLALLTGNTSFGSDANRWQGWWREVRERSPEQWQADFTAGLAARAAEQAAVIDALQQRLARALQQVYDATAPEARASLALGMLKDPLSEVRLTGEMILIRRIAAGATFPAEIIPIARGLLGDVDPRVRAMAARLITILADGEATPMLLERLKLESDDTVRGALVAALGHQRDPAATDAVIRALLEEPNGTAIAAAEAVEPLVQSKLLSEDDLQRLADALSQRYDRDHSSLPQLRGALLGAMRGLGRAEFAPLMRSALSDEVAAVRLEAIRGLVQMNDRSADDDIAALAEDPDRGVRQAAISALGVLGGPTHIETVLKRTREDTEIDPAVRRRAWDTLVVLLDRADTLTLATVADSLQRPDARDVQIQAYRKLLARPDLVPKALVDVQRKLAEALLSASRPAEAAEVLSKAYNPAGGPEMDEVWRRWIQALLLADDVAALNEIGSRVSDRPDLAGAAGSLLVARLNELMQAGQYDALINLAEQTNARLSASMAPELNRQIQALYEQASKARTEAERHRVQDLVKALAGGDLSARDDAEASLLAMRRRAVAPLIEQMKAVVQGEPASPELEGRLADLLSKLAPELNGYDATAARADKLKLLEDWRKRQGI